MKKLIALILSVLVFMTSLPSMNLVVSAKSETTKRYSVLVLDVSGTADFIGKGGEKIYTAPSAIDYVKQSANRFLTDLINAKGDNYVAVVTFTNQASVVVDFTDNISDVTQKVDNLTSNGQIRNINAGLTAANEMLQQLEPSATKNVVLVTTGMTNGGQYSYEGHYDEQTVGSIWRCADTQVRLYAYANAAYDAAAELKNISTLYVLGLFQTMKNIPEEGKEIADFFRLTASDLATSEDTFYDVDDPNQIGFAFGEIVSDMIPSNGLFKYAGTINEKYDSEAEYWYSDSYFNRSATRYNPSLATMSLCLELSSWSSYDKENWYSSEYTPADDEFWQDKLYNVKSLLLGLPDGGEGYEGLGFEGFAANRYWEDPPTENSIGVCAARKQIIDKNGKNYTLIALVVRGGGYYSEWSSNFKLGNAGEHSGFADARDNVLEFLDSYVSGLSEEESKNVKLWITGYSRAGATANMVAGALDSYHSLPNGLTTGIDDIYCYTFEAPQGAVRSELNAEDNNAYANIYNVLNLNDLVPMVAPGSWDFARYNYQNDVGLPSQFTSKNFDAQRTEMFQQLIELGYGGFNYKIKEVSEVKSFKINKSNLFSLGSPFWWWEESSVDTHTVLQSGINLFADNVIPSRAYYYENLQDCICKIAGIVKNYDYDKAGYGLKDYAGEIAKEAFVFKIKELFTFENITYIISPMLSLNPFYSYEERFEDVRARLGEKIVETFKDYANIEGFVDSVKDILDDVIVQIAIDAWNNNMDSINVAARFVDILASGGGQGHYPEICLAWCRSFDSNYNPNVIENASNITRLIRINCPVNIEVFDSNNNLVASITDNIAEEMEAGVVNYVNDKGEKILFLPVDLSEAALLKLKHICCQMQSF